MSRLVQVAVVATIVAMSAFGSACAGGDGDDKASATGTTTEGKEGTGAQREIDPSAVARAEAVLLRLSDLPDGWRGSPSEDDDDGDKEFRRCVGSDYSAFTITGEAESDEFSMGENTSVSSEATVLSNEADAEGLLEGFAKGMRSPSADDCFGTLIRDAIQGGDYKLGEVDVGELSFSSPRNVDEARAWQIAISLEPTSGEGLSPTLYLDVIYLRVDDVLASVFTEDVLSAFDTDLRRQLVEVVAGRMSQ